MIHTAHTPVTRSVAVSFQGITHFPVSYAHSSEMTLHAKVPSPNKTPQSLIYITGPGTRTNFSSARRWLHNSQDFDQLFFFLLSICRRCMNNDFSIIFPPSPSHRAVAMHLAIGTFGAPEQCGMKVKPISYDIMELLCIMYDTKREQ